jgi:hypothetical protein
MGEVRGEGAELLEGSEVVTGGFPAVLGAAAAAAAAACKYGAL